MLSDKDVLRLKESIKMGDSAVMDEKQKITNQKNIYKEPKAAEYVRKGKIQKHVMVLEALCAEYSCIVTVNPQEDYVTLYKKTGTFPILENMVKEHTKFSEIARLYMETFVHPVDRPRFANSLRMTYIMERLQKESTFTLDFRRIYGETENYAQFIFCMVEQDDGTPRIIVGIRDVDHIVKEKVKRNALIEALAYGYSAYQIVAWKTGEILDYHAVDTNLIAFSKRNMTHMNYFDLIQQYYEPFMVEEEKEEVLHQLSLDNIREQLSHKYQYVVVFKRDFGQEMDYIQLSFTRFERERGRKAFVVAMRDVTETIQREREQQQELKLALEKARLANEAKSIFLSNMSHDIRTPMNAISGFTDLAIANADDPEKVKSYLTKAQASSRHLLSLINDVLDMSRIESGKVALDEKVYSLKEILSELKDIITAQTECNKQQFSIKQYVQDDLVYCDKLRLNQILLNLLGNAVKYTKEGGTITLVVTQKYGMANSQYRAYEFRVCDTGVGMSHSFLERVFEAFERERTIETMNVQGTGLGLAITKNLVEMMNGNIEVRSELGKGSEFIVTLTLQIAGEKEKTQEYTVFAETTNGTLAGKRILLAEDNELNAEIAMEILHDTGAEIVHASNGLKAIEAFEASETGYFDLILMDIQMPIIGGYEATVIIRHLGRDDAANIPIIALSANAYEEDVKKSIAYGMDGHISKPIQVDTLMQTLQMAIEEINSNINIDEKWRNDRALKQFTMQCAETHAASGFFIYEAAPGEKLIYADEDACHIWGCDSFEELQEYTGNSFRGMVHPQDLASIEESIENQVSQNNERTDKVDYRIIRKDKTVVWLEDWGHKVKHEKYGDIFYVFVIQSCNKDGGHET